jgi:biopolymer transport protein ExbD
MRYSLLLLLFFFSCRDCPPDVLHVKIPESHSPRKNVLVVITSTDKIYIKDKEVPLPQLDSILKIAIDSTRDRSFDSARVIINADTASHYGVVYNVSRAAKRIGAMVVINVR